MTVGAAQKMRARAQVRRALERGILVRPDACPRCGLPDRRGRDGRSTIHAHHHNGYDRPLDIEWLCVTCHFQEDRRLGGAANGMSRLTAEQVAEIRRRYRPTAHCKSPEGSARALAREFGVYDSTIRRIVKNVSWIDAALGEQDA